MNEKTPQASQTTQARLQDTGPSTFRRLWHPPGRYADRVMDRRVTFLELFFDLVFVVLIAQLAHRLAEHPSWSGVGWFVFIFYAIWSSWVNGTLYHDLHTTNDVSVRVFTFAQMLAVALMAVHVAHVPGDGSSGFAVAYAANSFILVILWFRTGLHDLSHRPGSIPYSTGYLISASLFAISATIDPPLRYWLWALGLSTEIIGQLIGYHRWRPPSVRESRAIFVVTPSLIERLGLFVIIVLGEVIVGAVNGMAELADLDAGGIEIGILGVIVAIALWWVYFDLISHHAPVANRSQLWLYLHLPLVIAMAAGGAGVLNTVEHVEERLPDAVRWLLVGSLGAALASIALLSLTLEVRRAEPRLYRSVDLVMAIAVVLILLVGATDWSAKTSLEAMVVLLLAPVVAGIVVWQRHSRDPGSGPDTLTA
jgi:low temperature requirement protein LtrA